MYTFLSSSALSIIPTQSIQSPTHPPSPAGIDALSDEERGDSVIDSLLGEDEEEEKKEDAAEAAAQ